MDKKVPAIIYDELVGYCLVVVARGAEIGIGDADVHDTYLRPRRVGCAEELHR